MTFYSSYVDVGDNVQLHVMRRYGAGRKYVFLHGFGEGGFIWLPFARTLPESADLYLVDLRGHGESSWHAGYEYGLDRHTNDVFRVFNTLELCDIALIGHSLGARIAIDVANKISEHLWRLVLVDVGLETGASTLARIKHEFLEGQKLFSSINRYVEFASLNRPLARRETLSEIGSHALRKCAEGLYKSKADSALVRFVETTEEEGLWEKLSNIRAQTLLVRGEGSSVLSIGCAKKITSVMMHCQMVNIKIAGHGVMVDNPESFAAEVNQFLM